MRFICYLTIFTLIISYSALSQKKILKVPQKGTTIHKKYPIDGTPLLWKQDQAVAEWVKAHPDYNKQKLTKTTAAYSIGSTHSWWSQDFSTGNYYLVPSTCEAVGPNSYIFVETAQLSSGKVTQAEIDSVENVFENETPANANKGIFATDTSAFGNPPDISSDPRIIVLLLNIQSGDNSSSGYEAGYFNSMNEMTNTTEYPNSNDANIIYIDCYTTDLSTSDGLETAEATCAHEFQHMINWNYHQSNQEITFVNEGCSMLAEVNCGYPPFYPELYENYTNYSLFNWDSDPTLALIDYSRAQRFFIYWLDQFGIGIFKHVVQDNLVGLAGLENALASDAQKYSFTQYFIDWLIANKFENTNQSNLYGYPIHTGLAGAESKYTYYNPNVSVTDTVQQLAAEYITFTGGSNLNITFIAPSSSSLVIEAIEEGANSNSIKNVPLNTAFSVPGYGSTFTTVNFVAIDTNTTNNSPQVYSYSATGTAPSSETILQWDNTEPIGYFPFSPKDTVCVTFNAVAGGRLDSIRVGFANAGSYIGGVWKYTGFTSSSASVTSPLGTPLAIPITASISTNAVIVDDSSEYPYAKPFNNWSTVDLSSSNISTNNAFVVGFVVGADSVTPLVTNYPGLDDYHSYTYLQKGDGPPSGAGWYYIITSNSTIGIYLIRAYVSLLVTGVKQEIELTPKNFSLSQNYPNPFNPSTMINFAVPVAGRVKIVVYNQLGQQVALIANREYPAGNYSINFNASSLASGVYYYRIEAGSFTQTKKMVLLK
jgi:hypothetical protein